MSGKSGPTKTKLRGMEPAFWVLTLAGGTGLYQYAATTSLKPVDQSDTFDEYGTVASRSGQLPGPSFGPLWATPDEYGTVASRSDQPPDPSFGQLNDRSDQASSDHEFRGTDLASAEEWDTPNEYGSAASDPVRPPAPASGQWNDRSDQASLNHSRVRTPDKDATHRPERLSSTRHDVVRGAANGQNAQSTILSRNEIRPVDASTQYNAAVPIEQTPVKAAEGETRQSDPVVLARNEMSSEPIASAGYEPLVMPSANNIIAPIELSQAAIAGLKASSPEISEGADAVDLAPSSRQAHKPVVQSDSVSDVAIELVPLAESKDRKIDARAPERRPLQAAEVAQAFGKPSKTDRKDEARAHEKRPPQAEEVAQVLGKSGRTNERGVSGRAVDFEIAVQVDGERLGSLPMRINNDRTISVRLWDLVTLLQTRTSGDLFDALSRSSRVDEYVSFDRIRQAGIGVKYEPVLDQIIVSTDRFPGGAGG